MTDPPIWTLQQLEADRVKAIEFFRSERMEEPLEDYRREFDSYRGNVEELLKKTLDLAELEGTALEIVTDRQLLEVFRYLAAPPVSEDDLMVVAETPSLAKRQLMDKPENLRRLVQVVRAILDKRRFPWVDRDMPPTKHEREAAILASSCLMAARRVETIRRSTGKKEQEALVSTALKTLGLQEVPARSIPNISHAPALGEFCGESVLGTRKGDLVVRLWDHRVMPIECKVSNSYLNSVKRLNNDAAIKAVGWKLDFGQRQVVPVAVLSGVYKLQSLLEAQARGLTLFWSHDLTELTNWIDKTKP